MCPPKNPLDPCLNESKCDNALGCQTIDKCDPSNCDDNNACTLDVVNSAALTLTLTLTLIRHNSGQNPNSPNLTYSVTLIRVPSPPLRCSIPNRT